MKREKTYDARWLIGGIEWVFWTPQPQMQMMLQILFQTTRQIPKHYSFHKKGRHGCWPIVFIFLVIGFERVYSIWRFDIHLESDPFPNVPFTHADLESITGDDSVVHAWCSIVYLCSVCTGWFGYERRSYMPDPEILYLLLYCCHPNFSSKGVTLYHNNGIRLVHQLSGSPAGIANQHK